MTLTLLGETMFHMGPRTYMWISVLDFTFAGEPSDHDLLGRLIASPFYAHSYAWPFDLTDDRTEPTIHGPWWRDRITVDRFQSCDTDEAVRVLRAWANDQDWTDADFKQPDDALARLEAAIALFAGSSIYQLQNPSEADWHEWGGVVGTCGFHEFALIDRNSGTFRLVVATDD